MKRLQTILKPASFFIAISHLRNVWCITVVVNRITEYKTKLDFVLSRMVSCTHWLPLAPINFNYISFSTDSPSYCLYVFEMSDCVLFIFNCVVCLQIHVKFIIYSFFYSLWNAIPCNCLINYRLFHFIFIFLQCET